MNIKERLVAWFINAMLFLGVPASKILAFRNDTRGEASIGKILGLVIGIFVAGYTLPDAITALTNSSKYGATVPTAVVTIMTTVGGIVVAAVFLIMLYKGATD